ncbi:T9SS type B sorting domain-containing protein [Chitinophaga sp. G-6-1-13]|uniref:T9SS type B sorting domain-containing protein n=1 Tax=Chitinophaga fulva TaxID=2728842 RepID=A0A848GM76_9BACT|nr:Ig-like domain-containing protein [Chitinophaga fulva]NML38721.1 T9SS type B sorting domain-containing protein [Chitinophaga fulva]
MYIPKVIRFGWSCLLWCLLLAAMPASAQLSPSDFATDPQHTAITRDRNNNIYTVAYDVNGRVTVLKYLAGGSGIYFVYSELTGGPGLDGSFFSGIAVNSKDEVFLTTSFNDVGGSRILKVRFNGTGYDPAQLVRSGEGYTNLAFDQQDNLLVLQADGATGKYKLVKYLAGQENGAGIVLCDDNNVPGGFKQKDFFIHPWGLAVDKSNTVYFTTCMGAVLSSSNTNQVFRLKQGETTPTSVGSGAFTSLACDDNGNLYALEVELNTIGTPGRIRWGASGSQLTSMLYWGVANDVANGYVPLGITVTGNGNGSTIYFDQLTDYNNNPLIPGVKKLTPLPVIVTELSAMNATVTNANTVRYKFSTNLALSYTPGINAFSLSTTGLTGATITNVLPNINYYTIDVNTGTGDGTLTLALKNGGLINPASNAPYTGATYTIDKTPPMASIQSGPPAITSSKNASFAFTSNETVTYEVKLDGAAAVSGTSPFAYTGLSTGAHVFSVRAKDQAGNQSDWTSYNWTIVTMPTITNVTVPAPGFYNLTKPVVFDVVFDQDVTVNYMPFTTPYIELTVGSQVKQAKYESSPSPNTLRFSYQPLMGDEDLDGITVNNLNLNGATIRNAAGDNANTTLNNVGNTAGVNVNTTMPTCVISMSRPSPVNGSFTLTAVFSEAVTGVTAGTLSLVNATIHFTGGTGTTYTFTITPNPEGPYTMSIPYGAVRQAVGGNNNMPSNTINFIVDKTSPVVSSVVVPGGKYYREGDPLDFDVTFSEDIVVSTSAGVPSLQLTIGSATKQATFLNSPSPGVARFRYTIANGDMDNNGIAINSLNTNGGSIRDAATNDADLTLNNVGNTTGVLVNTVHPAVTITTPAPAFVTAAFTATITFSEVVSLFKPANITVTNADLSNMTTSDSITFTVTVSPRGDGPVTVQVPADAALNIGGNGNYASNALSLTADMTAPVVANVAVPPAGYYKIGSNLDFDLAFNEDVAVNTTGGTPFMNITIGSRVRQAVYVNSPSTTTMRFRYTVVPQDETVTGITINTLFLNGATIRDLAGNNANITLNNIGSTSGVKVNTTLPTCVISMPSSPVSKPFTLTLTFSEPVTGLDASDLNIAGAQVTNQQMVNASTFTFLISPQTEGSYTVYLPAGRVQQTAGGNDNQQSNTLTFTADMTPPKVTSVNVPVAGYYGTGKQLDFHVLVSEATTVTGTPSIPITIGSQTVQANYVGNNLGIDLLFRYVVQSGETDLDGISLGSAINLNGGKIQDIAGNDAWLALNNPGNSTGVFVHTAAPTVTLSTSAVSPVGKSFTIKATFSEKVSGLSDADFIVTNADVDPPSSADGGLTYTMVVKPQTDGAVTISLPANSAVNLAGTGNATSNTLNVTADVTSPEIVSVSVPGADAYAAGRILTFQARFNEPIIVTGIPSLTLNIGGKMVQVPYVSTGGGNTMYFNYQVQPGDNDPDGVELGAVIQLNGGTIKDAVGNDADLTLRGIPVTTSILVNTATPVVQLSTAFVSPVNHAFVITASFSEVVTGVTAASFQVTNGTADSVVNKNGSTYTLKITPVGDGPVRISVPANAAMNNAHTGNSASSPLIVAYDGTAPNVNTVYVPISGSYKAGQSLNFLVFMTEAVSVSGTPSIPVIIGSQIVQANYVSKTGPESLQFRYVVQPGDMDLDGISLGAAIQLNGGTIQDAAGNNAVLTLNNVGDTRPVLVTAQQPTVTLSTTAVSPVSQAFTVKIVFSEAVTGLAVSDIAVTNGTASLLQTGDNITYTVVITPSDGAVTVQVPASVAKNSVGNDNLASNTLTLQGDVTAPVVTSVGVPVNGHYKAGTPLNFSVKMSEPVNVTGAPSIPVIIGTQTVQATYTGGTGTATLQFSYTVQNGDNAPNGISLGSAIVLNGGSLKDAAGNDAVLTLQAVPATNSIIVKTSSPTVALSSTSSGRINTPFTVKLTFSDVVTGLTAAALQVANGTAGTLQTTDNINYTVVITPATDGNVTLQLPAGVAADNAGNNNLASNQLSLVYDATAPAISAQAFDVYDNSPAGTSVGQLTGTDASGTVKDWTLATDGSRGALSLDANGHITVKDNALLRTFAGKTISLQVSASDGLNISTAVPVTIRVQISYVNKQPVMDPVADVYICATTAAQTIQLTGVSPVEPDQHYTITLAANQPYFDVLKADVVTNTIRYQLKPGVTSGNTAITLTLKDDGGTDNGGKDTYSQTFYLTVNALPGVTISSDRGASVSKGDIVTLTATGAVTYSWEPASGTSGDLHQPTLTVRPNADATYKVTGTNAAGCSAAATISIRVADDYKLDATNLLTPNGDGKNDRWVIRNLDSYPDNEVKIFDRTGRLIYQRRNYSNDWDGTLNGHPLAEGTYYYVLTVNGTTRVWKGFITIIRNDQ